MMTSRFLPALALLCVGATAALGQERSRRIGDWSLDEAARSAFAPPLLGASSALLVRCMDGGLTVALADLGAVDRFVSATTYNVTLIFDHTDAIEASGVGVKPNVVALRERPPQRFVSALSAASILTARIEARDMAREYVFKVRGASQAIAPLLAACPAR